MLFLKTKKSNSYQILVPSCANIQSTFKDKGYKYIYKNVWMLKELLECILKAYLLLSYLFSSF